MINNEIKNTAFKVDYRSYREDTSTPDPEDEWDRANTHTDHSVEGIKVVDDNSFDVIGAFEIDPANPGVVYLVYAIYSTGDSFGHDSGYGIEFISVFKTQDKADKCAEQIEANAELYKLNDMYYLSHQEKEKRIKKVVEKLDGQVEFDPNGKINENQLYNAFYMDEKGGKVTISVPWNGYFESLDSVNVVELTPSFKPKNASKKRI
jgi:hypothetical protein